MERVVELLRHRKANGKRRSVESSMRSNMRAWVVVFIQVSHTSRRSFETVRTSKKALSALKLGRGLGVSAMRCSVAFHGESGERLTFIVTGSGIDRRSARNDCTGLWDARPKSKDVIGGSKFWSAIRRIPKC